MEAAATFYYISVSLVIWIVGALLAIVLVRLIKTLNTVQDTLHQVKASVSNFEVVKSAIASAITTVVQNLFSSRLLKGGGKRGTEK